MTYEQALTALAGRPPQITDTELWLFITANTARALIDSTNKQDLSKQIFEDCGSVGEVKLRFDTVQGIYGRKFDHKRHPAYHYLCSLIAFFPDKELSDSERSQLIEFGSIDKYLIYKL